MRGDYRMPVENRPSSAQKSAGQTLARLCAIRLLPAVCFALAVVVAANFTKGETASAWFVCGYSILPTSNSYSADKTQDTVQVTTTTTQCKWTATSNDGWINVTSPAGGVGTDSNPFQFIILANTGAPNTDTPPRTGSITVTGNGGVPTLTFTANQSGCTFSVASNNVCVPANAASYSVSVNTKSTICPWTASSNTPWIVVNTSSGTGDGMASYSVSQNSGIAARTGTLSAGGKTVTVNQFGTSSCAFPIVPGSQSFSGGGGSNTIAVTTPPCACTWTATPGASWITIDSGGSGSGNGTVAYSVAANPVNAARSSSITVAGQTLTVTQAPGGCSYQISPANRLIGPQSATGNITVTAPSGCTWTANPTANWITVISGATGTGNGMINYRAGANTSGGDRTGTITVADQTFTLTQTAAGACAYSLSPAGAAYTPAAASGSFAITAPAGCTWTANSNASWITFTGGTGGSGVGQIGYAVAANPGPAAREGTVTIADQTFTVDQAAPGDQADLSVEFTGGTGGITDGSSHPTGTRLTYTISVRNAGPNAATGVTLTTATPVGSSFASSSGPGSSATPAIGLAGPVTFSVGSIPPNTSASFSVVISILGAPGSTLIDNASVSSLTADPVAGNNAAMLTNPILGGGIVELSWDQAPSTAADPTPPPTNLRAGPAASALASELSIGKGIGPAASDTCPLIGYNVYKSTSLPVETIPENLWHVLPPTNNTPMPVAPAGSFYMVTSLWNCGGNIVETGLTGSGGSNQVGVPAPPNIMSVRVGGKLRATGDGFTDAVEVFLDNVAFSRPSSIRNDNTLLIQKGTLVDGRSASDVFVPGKTVLISFKNSDGGIGAFVYTQQ
jgi:uncharacterized repeat protein (TIGR01451 family)